MGYKLNKYLYGKFLVIPQNKSYKGHFFERKRRKVRRLPCIPLHHDGPTAVIYFTAVFLFGIPSFIKALGSITRALGNITV